MALGLRPYPSYTGVRIEENKPNKLSFEEIQAFTYHRFRGPGGAIFNITNKPENEELIQDMIEDERYTLVNPRAQIICEGTYPDA